jgi:hypothetical protein
MSLVKQIEQEKMDYEQKTRALEEEHAYLQVKVA